MLETVFRGMLVITAMGIFSAEAKETRVDNSTLTGKVMCGYQGWFRTPFDGMNDRWVHYQHPNRKFEDGHCGIDYWPDMSEMGPDEKHATAFRHKDGSVAYVYSSVNRDSTVRHFKWMRDYGIDGIFLQRFATVIATEDNNRRTDVASLNQVLKHCREGANQYGRTYAIMYDLSRMTPAAVEKIKADWKTLVSKSGITKDPNDQAYQHHRGKPIVGIWGVGFNDDREYTSKDCLELINFFKHDPEYGGNTVLIGTPLGWRDGWRDAGAIAEWEQVYKAADIISPWTIGRFGTIQQAQEYAENRMRDDIKWCAKNNIDYLPVVFPGFGWENMLKGISDNAGAFIDRQDGKFLWAQYEAVVKAGATMVYQAMFDEMDEGTQIFKIDNNPPSGESRFKTYNGLPPDHYLWLVGEAAKMVRGDVRRSPVIPKRSEQK